MEYTVKPYKKFFKEDRRNLIPKAFDKWIEKKFGNFAHFLVQYDVQDNYIYREDVFREDYETDEEYYKATDKLRQSELNDYVSELLECRGGNSLTRDIYTQIFKED